MSVVKKISRRMLVVDDHPLFRYGLAELLLELEGVEEVDQASDGNEAMEKIRETSYDLVFLDVEMPNKNGAATLADIRQLESPPKVIIISMHANLDKIQQFYGKGVSGYILKNTSVRELNLAISLIMDGEEYYSRQVLETLVKSKKRFSHEALTETPLTPSELRVLELICQQESNEEIARQMSLSSLTVKRHRQNIKDKIGAKNTVGFVLYAIKHGVITMS